MCCNKAQVKLLIMISVIPAKVKVLVIAPHPDDETLCCGGILARHVERGDDVRVLIVTDGRYGAPTPELYGTDQLVRTRIEESRKATSKLGIPWETGFHELRRFQNKGTEG